MKLGTMMTMLGMGAVLTACDCCPQGEAKALSQDKELRAVMDNFTQNEVPAATPLVEKREVELIRLVSLTTQQSGALLQEEVATALAQGLAPEEILEAIYQCAPYTGFPRTVDAVEIARSVFKAKNVKVDENRGTVTAQSRLEAGADAQGTLFGQTFRDMAKNGKSGMPTINYFLASNCFGDYYTRKGLDLNTRELLTMAILVNLGTEPQLKAHIGANLKIRTAEYVEQAIYNCLPYCGYPRTLNALRLLKEAVAETKVAEDTKTMPGKDWSVFPVGKPNDAYAKYFVGKSYLDMISKEQVVQVNPDMFLLPTWNYDKHSDPEKFARELMEDPAYRNVKAVKNKKMVYVSDRYRYVASHHIVDAVENIAYAVYPELFPEGKPEDQE